MSNSQFPQEMLSGSPQPHFTNFSPGVITAKRDPTSQDLGYQIGQFWINKTTGSAFILTKTAGGQALWVASAGLNDYPITPFVVGPVGKAGYQTIQSAIDVAAPIAAATGAAQAIYIQPGTYTENLVIQSGIVLVGTGGFGFPNITDIVGTHTPPLSGGCLFKDVHLTNSTDIFSSSAVGTAAIILDECFIDCNNYTFNLPNWNGNFFAIACQNEGGGTDGWVNNSGGSNANFFNSQVGFGNVNAAQFSGGVNFSNCTVNCPVTCNGTATMVAQNTLFTQTVTMNNSSSMQMFGCAIFTMSNNALIYDTSVFSLVVNTMMNSSAVVIDGIGAGTLALSNFCCPFNFFVGAGVNILFSGSTISGGVVAGGDNNGVPHGTSLTAVNSTTIGAGVGSINMSSANPATNSAWIKIYIGTIPYWIPAWTTNSP
jgi:hypothetical protein